MYEKGLVSIIVTCLNGEEYLNRLFHSIEMQTYKKIQFIFVNDGSIDGTEEVFWKYDECLKKNGIQTIYCKQNHEGQSAAINRALPYVRGEYMMWMDADDFILPNHIKKKVLFLKKNSQYEMIMCKGIVVSEKNVHKKIGELFYKNVLGNLFEDILFDYCGCTNGLFMVRTEAFFSIFPNKSIYLSPVGQNLQMLLPLLANYKVGYIEDVLFAYVVRSDSHSHKYFGLIEKSNRIKEIYSLKRYIVNRIIGFQDLDYKSKLNRILGLRELQFQLGLICSEESTEEFITKEIIRSFSSYFNMCKDRYWIWGYNKQTKKLAKYLSMYSQICISGFIDSDTNKLSTNVKSPDDIKGKLDYIVIPIGYHKEIIDKLNHMSYISRRDFFYIDYEIREGK